MAGLRSSQPQRRPVAVNTGAEWRAPAAAPAGIAPSAVKPAPPMGQPYGPIPILPPAIVQRAGPDEGGAPPDTALAARIAALAGGGSSLPLGARQQLEAGIGANLSAARVHTGGEADQLARRVDAVAFTTGPDIFFRTGADRPDTPGGLRLLAHEATHVAQQAAGPVAGTPAPGGVTISDPGDRFHRRRRSLSSAGASRRRFSPRSGRRRPFRDRESQSRTRSSRPSIGRLTRKCSRLVDLPPESEAGGRLAHSLELSAYPLVARANLEPLIIRNALATMRAAGQLDYIRTSKLIDRDFVIVVEVHYYRSRDVNATKFHKDTRGETLFVNLNFTNAEEILGPEYIVNPASDPRYDRYVAEHLPPEFVADLNAVKGDLPGQKHIHATVVPQKGVVAFVDEAIHHKTPTPGRRTVSSVDLATVLKAIYGDEYDDAAQAYGAYKNASMFSVWPWSTYFKTDQGKRNADAWYAAMEAIARLKERRSEANREELAAMLPQHFHGDVDRIVEEGGSSDFTSVTYTHVLKDDKDKPVLLPVKVNQPGQRALKRTMSESDLSKYAAKTGGGKRTFFRTWVRAVSRAKLR